MALQLVTYFCIGNFIGIQSQSFINRSPVVAFGHNGRVASLKYLLSVPLRESLLTPVLDSSRNDRRFFENLGLMLKISGYTVIGPCFPRPFLLYLNSIITLWTKFQARSH